MTEPAPAFHPNAAQGGPATPEPGADSPAGTPVSPILLAPPIDFYETPEGLVLTADLPGVSPEHLDLQVQGQKLTLLGRVSPLLEGIVAADTTADPASTASRTVAVLREEFAWGDYLRSFILSQQVDTERMTARLQHGVLEVTLPRAAPPPGRKIPIHGN